MTTEQPYFVVKVTRCGDCPYRQYERLGLYRCSEAPWHLRLDAHRQNENGITPTCQMWPQRVQEKKE